MYCCEVDPYDACGFSSMCGDGGSLTAGRSSLMKSLKAEVAVGAPDKSRSGDGGVSRRAVWLFKWEALSGAVSYDNGRSRV
ncbi:hypothetical protein Zmor_006775 [Zophobas morio]|uniref:Uncharacterized protein n=1 Tax=Zophobas morio TaxID=2755281 RepID=A0AA38IUF4_9CUCU|nr:hypothetical protein Zmor_006775 [Zophobas morio]